MESDCPSSGACRRRTMQIKARSGASHSLMSWRRVPMFRSEACQQASACLYAWPKRTQEGRGDFRKFPHERQKHLTIWPSGACARFELTKENVSDALPGIARTGIVSP